MLAALVDEAYELYDEGIADFKDIDLAIKKGLNHPLGPFELSDYSGLDIHYYAKLKKFEESGDPKDEPKKFLEAVEIMNRFRAAQCNSPDGSYAETFRLVKRLLQRLSLKRRRSLLTLLPIAIITGLIDLLVVALVSRVFTAVVGQENKPPIPFSDLITNDPLTKAVLLISAYVTCNWIASFSRLLLRAKQEKLRASVFLELSNIAQKNVLTQNYDFFLTDKSQDLSSKILLNISRVSEKLIRPILQIVSGFFIVSFIFIAIVSFAKITALYLMISLLFSYLGISLLVTPFIRKAAKERINLESEIKKVMTESIRTIVDVHLSGSEKFFQERHNKAGEIAFPFLWKAETYPELPRALIEPLGITLIFSIGLFPLFSKNSPTNLLEIVPFLATIAVASLKLTPPLQDLFRGITDLRAGIPDVEEALSIIELIKSTASKVFISLNLLMRMFFS